MKIRFLILLLFLLQPDVRAGYYFVKLTPHGQQQLLQNRLLKNAGIQYRQFKTFNKSIPVLQNWLVLSADSQQIVEYQSRQLVQLYQPVGRFKIFPLTNDSLSGQQWYLEKINIAQAWQITQGAPDVLVAIIDTGIDYRHPDLEGSLWLNPAEKNGQPGVDDDGNGLIDDVMGWDFTDAPRFADGGDYLTPDPDPMDEFPGGHGTEIAGIIGARINNLHGIAGIAPDVKILNLRAGTASGYLEEDDVIQAMLYAYAMGAKVINMSFGDLRISTLFKDVVHYLWQQGVTFVAAAGNEGQPQVYFPAALKETIAVGSSDQDDRLSTFSNFGYGIDLIAPGTEIISTAPGNQYRTVSGTSFSAPMVSSVCALLFSANSRLSNENLRTILRQSAKRQLPNPHWQVGAGRLDAGKALLIQNGGNLQLFASIKQNPEGASVLLKASAFHPDLKTIYLDYGIGDHPDQWKPLAQWQFRYFYNDTLLEFAVNDLPDTLLTFRLKMELLNGTILEDLQQIRLDRSRPKFKRLLFNEAISGNNPIGLVQFETDDPVSVKLLFLEDFQSPPLDSLEDFSLSKEHFFTLNRQQVGQAKFLQIFVHNSNGLKSETNFGWGNYFLKQINWLPWKALPLTQTPAASWLLPQTIDLNLNQKPEIAISEYLPGGAIGPLKVYELKNNTFELLTFFPQNVLPRDGKDVDGDGRQELLVTYGNRAKLLKFKPEQNTFQVVWQDSNFWAGNLTDCNNDGQTEIVGYRDSTYYILQNQGNFNFVPLARLTNHTSGENRFGSPKVVVNDFNQDGHNEIVFGDYDGDVIIYTCSEENQFYLWQTLKTYQADATDLMAADSNELFVLSHTPDEKKYESELAQLYWTLDVFAYHPAWRELSSVQQLHFYPYYSKKSFNAGLQHFKHNGRQLLVLALYPSLYILEKKRFGWEVIWQRDDCNSNSIVSEDLDKNGVMDILFNSGQQLVAFSESNFNTLSAPYNLKAVPLDSQRIHIEWQGVNYDGFNLYRGLQADHMEFLTHVSEHQYLDTNLLPDQKKYLYAVTAVKDSRESVWSNFDSVEICAAPRLTNVQKAASNVFILHFNQKIELQSQPASRVWLTSNQLWARSLSLLPGNQDLLAVFDLALNTLEKDTLKVSNIVNQCQMPLHPAFNHLPVDLNADLVAPRVSELKVCSRNCVQLSFSQPMDSTSLQNVENYLLWPWGDVVQVEILDSLASKVRLHLSQDSPAGGFGNAVYLQVKGLKNRWQVPMAEEQKFSLFRPVEDMSQIVIYPQPVRAENKELIFAKLPQKAQIQIFNLNGILVKTLDQVNEYGGLHWDLTDQSGNHVASGIYLYRITDGKQDKIGKLVIVR